jgi:hypothetical protein
MNYQMSLDAVDSDDQPLAITEKVVVEDKDKEEEAEEELSSESGALSGSVALSRSGSVAFSRFGSVALSGSAGHPQSVDELSDSLSQPVSDQNYIISHQVLVTHVYIYRRARSRVSRKPLSCVMIPRIVMRFGALQKSRWVTLFR